MNSGQIKLLETRKFLREKEVSDIYGINRNTLRRQRWGDYGIPFQVFNRKKGTNRGGTILYLIDDIEAAMQKKIPTRKL
ncbi:MAG: hypothetical protein QF855_01495 [Candidatus Pacebacteria bacterium]|jgi:hypothetical protein|nr:hypothetical protein [Candidatus Paceibacterota bacterium]|tara:strand:+ start:293 stop:529 length:237 start_codon:yes stop_codon:yes gene_type:complete